MDLQIFFPDIHVSNSSLMDLQFSNQHTDQGSRDIQRSDRGIPTYGYHASTYISYENELDSISDTLKEEYKYLLLFSGKTLTPEYFELLHSRTDKTRPLRGRYVLHMAKLMKQLSPNTINMSEHYIARQLTFIVEVIMMTLYYDNQILDRKGGVRDMAAFRKNLIIRLDLQDALDKYLDRRIQDISLRFKMKAFAKDVYDVVRLGQRIEKQFNQYRNWLSEPTCDSIQMLNKLNTDFPFMINIVDSIKKGINKMIYFPVEKQHYLTIYLQRIYLTNAYFFIKIIELLTDIYSIRPTDKQRLVEFAGCFGMMQQIINDNTDFVSSTNKQTTIAKNHNDALSDLRNGVVTLPIMIHLCKWPTSAIQRFLHNNQHLNKEAHFDDRPFAREISQSHSIYYSMTAGKKIRSRCLDILNGLEDTGELMALTDVAENNRFYEYLYNFRDYSNYKKFRNIPLDLSNTPICNGKSKCPPLME